MHRTTETPEGGERDHYLPTPAAAILCLYDLNDCTGGLVIELVKTHPRMMINRLVVENPWYLSPEDHRASRQTHGR